MPFIDENVIFTKLQALKGNLSAFYQASTKDYLESVGVPIEWLEDLINTFQSAGIAAQLQTLRVILENWIDANPLDEKASELLKSRAEVGLPYTIAKTEPRNIKQIKKVINALWLGETAVYELENMEVINDDTLAKLFICIEQITESIKLATHIEFNYLDFYQEQAPRINYVGGLLQSLNEKSGKPSTNWVNNLEDKTLLKVFGEHSGSLLECIRPRDSLDTFDNQVMLSVYQNISALLDGLSNHVFTSKNEKNIAAVDELKADIHAILITLGNIFQNGFQLRAIILHLPAIFQIVQKVQNVFVQSGVVNDEIQAYITKYLDILKNELAPTLLDLSDKAQLTLMLDAKESPYSIPLLNKLDELYQEWVYGYTGALIPPTIESNIRFKTLVDYQFIEKRASFSIERIKRYQEELAYIKIAALAFDKSWAIAHLDMEPCDLTSEKLDNDIMHLVNGSAKNKTFQSLNEKTKSIFIEKYKQCQFIVAEVSPTLDASIVEGINQKASLLNWQSGISLKEISQHKKAIYDGLEKAFNTYQLQIDLEEKNLNEGYRQGFAKMPQTVPLALKTQGNATYIALAELKKDKNKIFDIGMLSQIELSLKRSLLAFNEYVAIRERDNALPISSLDKSKRVKIGRLYFQFRDFLAEFHFQDGQAFGDVDEAFVDVVSVNLQKNIRNPKTQVIDNYKEQIKKELLECLQEVKRAKKASIFELYQKQSIENKTKGLIPLTTKENRQKVIKAEIEGPIDKIYQELNKLLEVFAKPTLESIQMNDIGLPFPGIEDPQHKNEEEDQTKSIKRLYNAIFYLKRLAEKLRALDDSDKTLDKVTYLYHSSYIYIYYSKLTTVIQELCKDDFLNGFLGELLKNLQSGQKSLLDFFAPYTLSDIQVLGTEHINIEYQGFFRTMNAIYYAPSDIERLNHNIDINEDAQIAIHKEAKQITHYIERMISSISQKPFLNTFRNSTTIYRVYHSMADKLHNLKEVTYSVAIDRLDVIRTGLLLDCTTYLDNQEISLGLKHDLLSSGYYNNTLDFFKGLVSQLKIHPDDSFYILHNHQWLEKRIENVVQERKKTCDNMDKFESQKAKALHFLEEIQRLKEDFDENATSFNLSKKITHLYLKNQSELKKHDRDLTQDFLLSTKKEDITSGQGLSFIPVEPHDSNNVDDNLATNSKLVIPKVVKIKDIKKPRDKSFNNQEKLQKIEKAVELMVFSIQGKINTQQLKVKLLDMKKAHLSKTYLKQKEQSKIAYEKLVFDSYMPLIDSVIDSNVGVSQPLKKIYKNELLFRLNQNKDELITNALNSDRKVEQLKMLIELENGKLLEENMRRYRALEKVYKLLENYSEHLAKKKIKKGSFYEGAKLIIDKQQKLNELKACYENQSMNSASSLLSHIQKEIKIGSEFYTVIAKSPEGHGISHAFLTFWHQLREIVCSALGYPIMTPAFVLESLENESVDYFEVCSAEKNTPSL